jgi:hypothetical protein
LPVSHHDKDFFNGTYNYLSFLLKIGLCVTVNQAKLDPSNEEPEMILVFELC